MSTGGVALVVAILALAVAGMAAVDYSGTRGQSANTTATSQTSSTTQGTNSQVAPTTRHFILVAGMADVQIAPNVTYHAWVFNGTAPGPTIMVNQGDEIVFKLINNDTMMAHSIDFHAAQIDWATNYASIGPGRQRRSTSPLTSRGSSCTTAVPRRCLNTSGTACTGR